MIRVSATSRWASFALLVGPLRNRTAAITGRLLAVLMVPSSTFRPFTPL